MGETLERKGDAKKEKKKKSQTTLAMVRTSKTVYVRHAKC